MDKGGGEGVLLGDIPLTFLVQFPHLLEVWLWALLLTYLSLPSMEFRFHKWLPGNHHFPVSWKNNTFGMPYFFKDIITWWSFPSITFLLSFFIWILRIMLLFCCLMSPITFLLNPACHDKVPFRCHYLSFDVVLVFFFIDYFYKMNCFSAETCPKHHKKFPTSLLTCKLLPCLDVCC